MVLWKTFGQHNITVSSLSTCCVLCASVSYVIGKWITITHYPSSHTSPFLNANVQNLCGSIQVIHGENMAMFYFIFRYSIDWKSDLDSYFDIDPVEGTLSTNELLDRESIAQHNIFIVATKLSKCHGDSCRCRCPSFRRNQCEWFNRVLLKPIVNPISVGLRATVKHDDSPRACTVRALSPLAELTSSLFLQQYVSALPDFKWV